MNFWRAALVIGLGLWLAGGMQSALSSRLEILGAQPDFILTFLIATSLCLTRTGGAVVGFLAGLTHGAVAGANLTHYVISRTFTGFTAAWSRKLGFELHWITVFFTALTFTIIARLVQMFLAPPAGGALGSFLGDTIRAAVYNGVLAMPLYALLKRVLSPAVR